MVEVLLTKPFQEKDIERFRDFPEVHVTAEFYPSEEALERAEVIIGRTGADNIRKAKNLKWFQCTNAGVDNYLPLRELFETRAVLTNMSGAYGEAISEWALTMTLALCKRLQVYRDLQNEACWKDMGWQLTPRGKNLLILGAGNIGTETAKLFRPFGCKITGMRRTRHALPEYFDAMITPDELDAALPEADIIICALPGTPETVKLLNAERLALLKPKAVLVNVGRGSLIDCEALAARLEAGLLWGAALDVTDPEPLPADHPLWRCANAIITPHITGSTFGHSEITEEATFRICRENLARYLRGEVLLNRVDLNTGYRVAENHA